MGDNSFKTDATVSIGTVLQPRRRHPRRASVRLICLGFLLIVTILLIALLEVAARSLPNELERKNAAENITSKVGEPHNHNHPRYINEARQITKLELGEETTSPLILDENTFPVDPTTSAQQPGGTGVPNPNAFLNTDETSTSIPMPSVPFNRAFLNTDAATEPAPAPTDPADVPLIIVTPAPTVPDPTSTDPADLSNSDTTEEISPPWSTPPTAPNPNAFVETADPEIASPVTSAPPTLVPNPNAFVETVNSDGSPTLVPVSNAVLRTDARGSVVGFSQFTGTPVAVPLTDSVGSVTGSTLYTGAANVIPMTDSAGSITALSTISQPAYVIPVTDTAGVVTGYVPYTGGTFVVPMTNSEGIVTGYSTGGVPSATGTAQDVRTGPYAIYGRRAKLNYFIGAYLPTLLAVMFSIPWLLIDRKSKSMEAFHQLSRPEGASASSTLTFDHASPLAPFRYFYFGHWYLVMTTSLTGITMLITPLASETIHIRAFGDCGVTANRTCRGEIMVYEPALRVVQGLLALMALILTFFLIKSYQRTSNVESDPGSLAGLAVILGSRETEQDFLISHGNVTQKGLIQSLANTNYKLDYFLHPNGETVPGIVKCDERRVEYFEERQDRGVDPEYDAVQWQPDWTHAHRYKACLLMLLHLALMAVIIAYRFTTTGEKTGFEAFMSSQTFGVRFLFTAVGVVISMFWRQVFQKAALLAPYRRLFQRNATAQSTILMTVSHHPVVAIPSVLHHKHFTLTMIAIASLLADVLTILLATIPFQPSNLWVAYEASTWFSVGMLTYMTATLVLLFFYHEPDLKLNVNTVAAHLYYLAGSGLISAFSDLASLKTKERDQRIIEKREVYGLGMIVAEDGTRKAAVDFDRYINRT